MVFHDRENKQTAYKKRYVSGVFSDDVTLEIIGDNKTINWINTKAEVSFKVKQII